MMYMQRKRQRRIIDSKRWKCGICNKLFEYSEVIELGDGVVCLRCANINEYAL